MCIRDRFHGKNRRINQPFGQNGVNRHRQEEPVGWDGETEEELVNEELICMATEEVIGKPTMVVKHRILLVPNLKGTPRGEPTGEGIRQEIGNENQMNWEGPCTVKKGMNDAVQGHPSSINVETICQFRMNRVKEGAVLR